MRTNTHPFRVTPGSFRFLTKAGGGKGPGEAPMTMASASICERIWLSSLIPCAVDAFRAGSVPSSTCVRFSSPVRFASLFPQIQKPPPRNPRNEPAPPLLCPATPRPPRPHEPPRFPGEQRESNFPTCNPRVTGGSPDHTMAGQAGSSALRSTVALRSTLPVCDETQRELRRHAGASKS